MAYVIKSGDTLSALAKQNNTTIADIMKANPSITDPNKIISGRTLNFSAPAARTLPPADGTPPIDISNKVQGVNAPPATTDPSQPDANSMFSKAMVGILKGFQGVQKTGLDMQNQSLGVESQQAQLGYKPLPSDVQNLQLNAQQDIQYRSGAQGVLDPTIQALQDTGKQYVSQYQDAADRISNVLQQQQTIKQQQQKDAQSELQNLFTQYGSQLKNLDPAKLSQLEKAAGYSKGMVNQLVNLETIKEQQQKANAQQKDIRSVNGGLFDVNANKWVVAPKTPSPGKSITPGLVGSTPGLGIVPSGVRETSALVGKSIIDGNQPPNISNSLSGQGFEIKAYLEANGYNLTKATQDWNAVVKWQATVNSATFQRAIVAADSATNYIQNLRNLSSQWESSNFPVLNYVNFEAALQGVKGQDQQALAQQIKTQIVDLTQDMSSVYRYGLSGTDNTLKSSGETLSTNWGNKQLNASLDIIDQNLKVRINSLKSTSNVLSASGNDKNQYIGNQSDQGGGSYPQGGGSYPQGGGSYQDYLKAIGQ